MRSESRMLLAYLVWVLGTVSICAALVAMAPGNFFIYLGACFLFLVVGLRVCWG